MKSPHAILIALLGASAIFAPQRVSAQGYIPEKIRYLDADGRPSQQKNAVLIEQILQFNDTLWEHNEYPVGRPMRRSVRYSDPEGKTLNGRYLTYDEKGIVDTFGNYSKGKRSGSWDIFTSQGQLVAEQFYEDGELIWAKDTVQLKQEADRAMAFKKDSTAKGSGIFTRVDKESEFRGGAAGWLRYLNKNSHYPDYAVMHRIMGTVVIAFIVDAEGQVLPSSAFPDTSLEFHLDREASRLIFQSPDWTPAVQNGENVSSYKKQSIVFQLQRL